MLEAYVPTPHDGRTASSPDELVVAGTNRARDWDAVATIAAAEPKEPEKAVTKPRRGDRQAELLRPG